MIGKAVGNTTLMVNMVFEVIQPDLEIDGRHAATLLFPYRQQCASRFGQSCGGILANSGSGGMRTPSRLKGMIASLGGDALPGKAMTVSAAAWCSDIHRSQGAPSS